MTTEKSIATDRMSAEVQPGTAPADGKPNTVHAGLTKFSEGQEVTLPGGLTGKVMKVEGDKYLVAHGTVTEFDETDLA